MSHAAFPCAELRAAIIDLDGTMVDTLGDFVAVLRHTLADMGCNPIEIARVDRGFVEMTVGKGTEDLLRRSLAHAWGLPDDAAEVADADLLAAHFAVRYGTVRYGRGYGRG